MRFFRPSFLMVSLFPEALFREKRSEKVLYLTFDDGPDILSTPKVLDILAKQKIKAAFFCSGRSASANPSLIERIKSEGHLIGNHGFDHLKGFSTSLDKYLTDFKMAAEYTSDNLFRPPYGSLSIGQYREIKKSCRIIMWDLMPYDFDQSFGSERSLRILKKLSRPGSVIVLHDTYKSSVLDFIEDFILFATSEGYVFRLPLK
jgi:peptidoglycan-N-acetylglucosamine deacetylase